MTEGQYLQEFECSFEAAILGAYYAKEMGQAGRRITEVPYFPGTNPVITAWDLGIDDSTAIIFVQYVGQEIHILDYHEENGQSLAHYCGVLQEKQRLNGWVYGDHIFPHDGGHKQLSTGESLADTFRKVMKVAPVVLERAEVNPGIDAVRNMLPRVWFDQAKTERLVEALRNYRSEWDEDKKTFKPKPLHDWSSHGCDAMRYLAMYVPNDWGTKRVKPETKWVI
jgi:hypothetical protein